MFLTMLSESNKKKQFWEDFKGKKLNPNQKSTVDMLKLILKPKSLQ